LEIDPVDEHVCLCPVAGCFTLFETVPASKLACPRYGVVGSTLVFFYLSPVFFFAGLREAQLKGEVTFGMPALGGLVLVLFGTAVQVLLPQPFKCICSQE
jgi:hypothetical protein